MVFCCLSHDVIAHETTHALLDGMHRRFIEPATSTCWPSMRPSPTSAPCFQHFSLPEVLRQQIAQTRGDLGTDNLLAQLAQEFGAGHRAARRAAQRARVVQPDQTGPVGAQPSPTRSSIQSVTEPHARGSLLVAAVFEAFLSIYKVRTADLLRIATGGTGVLPQGELHPDLVNRLADEAAKAAEHVLNMCIRALDYCPPVDLTFGDYLRALITADYDLVPDDDLGYRVAFIEAFRQYGIYPLDVRSLSIDSLRWQPPLKQDFSRGACPCSKKMRRLAEEQGYTSERELLYDQQEATRRRLVRHAAELAPRQSVEEMAIGIWPASCERRQPLFEVHSARPARRVGPDGQTLNDVIIEVTQRRPVYADAAAQHAAQPGPRTEQPPDFWFRGGATLVVDLETGRVRYAVARTSAAKTVWHQRVFRGIPRG